MRAEVTTESLRAALDRIAPVVPNETSLPILSHVLLETIEHGLVVRGTDLEILAEIEVKADVVEPGTVAVPARQLQAWLLEMSRDGHDADSGVDAESLSVRLRVTTNGHLALECGRSRCELVGRDIYEFPVFPTIRFDEGWRARSDQVQLLVEHTAFAASTDASRPILNGVLWQFSLDRMRMVASDGHRLAILEVPTPEATVLGRSGELIISPRTLDRIIHLCDPDTEIEIGRGGGHLGIRSPSLSAYTRLIEGPYPNYEQVIPKDNDKVAVADRERLALGVRRMDWLADEPTRSVWLSLRTGQLQFGRVHPSVRPFGGMTDQMAVDYQGSPLDIGFNSAYLLEALQHMPTPTVRLRFGGPSTPALVEPEAWDGPARYIGLVMPLRDETQ